jgi:hypothetical protein
MGTGLGQAFISDQLHPLLAEMADVYRYYRVTHFKATLAPALITSAATGLVLQFYGGSVDNPPVRDDSLADFAGEYLAMALPNSTVPAVLTVPRSGLKGPHNWYYTTAGTRDQSEETIGVLYLAATQSTISGRHFTFVEMTVEFTELLDASVIAYNIANRAKTQDNTGSTKSAHNSCCMCEATPRVGSSTDTICQHVVRSPK